MLVFYTLMVIGLIVGFYLIAAPARIAREAYIKGKLSSDRARIVISTFHRMSMLYFIVMVAIIAFNIHVILGWVLAALMAIWYLGYSFTDAAEQSLALVDKMKKGVSKHER